MLPENQAERIGGWDKGSGGLKRWIWGGALEETGLWSFSVVTTTGKKKTSRNQNKWKRLGEDIGGRMQKKNSPEILVQLSLLQAAPEHTVGPLREQYKMATKQEDIPSCKQDVRMTRLESWVYNFLCTFQLLLMTQFACVLSTHPGVAVGRSWPMAECLCWVFVVDLQARMIRNVPAKAPEMRR